MKTNKLYLTFFALLMTVSVYAQRNGEKPFFTKDFSETSLNALKVQTSGGSITVEGDRNSGVRVEMYVRANNWNGNEVSDDEIEDRLKLYDITIRRENDMVVAIAKLKDNNNMNWKKGLSISFKVATPRNFTTDLKTSGGSIHLASLTGEQNFTTSGGSIHVDGLKGNIKGRTSGGSIEATHCSDDVDLTTSGGSIKAESMMGNIRLITSGGSISLADLNGKVRAATSGGGIRADGIQGELDASTSGGSIRMQNLAASVKASTSAGSIEADFDKLGDFVSLSTSSGSVRVNMPLNKGLDLDLRGNKVSIDLKNFDGRMDKDRVQGSLNGGGIPIKLSASSGSVYVNQ
ncbi:DUF4097 family beta strand repeat-containing protein [Salmonirosea aquatica]|uniref:DUF4097 family beta strand repeat protein n=1 Tax=Salmonirosea aquatica TaxID=2654236 RepID=A0A7C9BQ17_9BACT|nr:DUF4097 family beta strand repeat protein [Cytophagaceae bacterium SJW1-29]